MKLLESLGWHQMEQFFGQPCAETRMPIDDLIEGLEIAKENIREKLSARRERRPAQSIDSIAQLLSIRESRKARG